MVSTDERDLQSGGLVLVRVLVRVLVIGLVIGLVVGLVVGLDSDRKVSIIRQSMETMRSSSCFPSARLRCVERLTCGQSVEAAAHSSADPCALSKNRQEAA
jgi:hypothetical protein